MARHDIPEDGAPHAPTSECGCSPQLTERDGRYAHNDQADVVDVDQVPADSPDGGAL